MKNLQLEVWQRIGVLVVSPFVSLLLTVLLALATIIYSIYYVLGAIFSPTTDKWIKILAVALTSVTLPINAFVAFQFLFLFLVFQKISLIKNAIAFDQIAGVPFYADNENNDNDEDITISQQIGIKIKDNIELNQLEKVLCFFLNKIDPKHCINSIGGK